MNEVKRTRKRDSVALASMHESSLFTVVKNVRLLNESLSTIL